MSTNVNFFGGIDRFEAHVPSSTAKETAKTVQDDNTILAGWMIKNNSGAVATVTLSYNDGDGEIEFYVKQIADDDTVIENGFNLRLISGGVIYATSDRSSGVTVSFQTVLAVSDRVNANYPG